MCAYVCVCPQVHKCGGGQTLFPHLFPWESLSVNWGLPASARLAGQQAPRISTLQRGYKKADPTAHSLMLKLGIWTQGAIFTEQLLFIHWAISPALIFSIFQRTEIYI